MEQLPFLADEVKKSRAPFVPFPAAVPAGPLKSGVACVAGTFHHGNHCLKQRARFVAPRAAFAWKLLERSRVRMCVYAPACRGYVRVHRHARLPAQVRMTAPVVSLRCNAATTRTISKITVDIRNYQLLSRYAFFFMRARGITS